MNSTPADAPLHAAPGHGWRLTVRREFAASHCLRHYQGKCERLHGHNFAVEAVVAGEALLPGVEFLMDFGDLKAMVDGVLAALDHRHLNEVPPFDRLNPSSENLARHVFDQLRLDLASRAPGVRLVAVTVHERAGQCATYGLF